MSTSQWYLNNYFLKNNKEDIVVFLSENVLNIYNFFQFTQRLFPENKVKFILIRRICWEFKL